MLSYQHLVKYEYISFDVFDTLIRRSVAKPSDLFEIMEHMGAPRGFALERIKSEHNVENQVKSPATLDEIYDDLYKRCGCQYAELKEMELELEYSGCVPNGACVDLFRHCVESGKTVVLISDMYLPSKSIERMLEKCGISGYKKLFVSCEYKTNKRCGGLYRQALDELGIKPHQLFHVGDNFKLDYIRPIEMGIHAYWKRNDLKKRCHVSKDVPPEQSLIQRTIQASVSNASASLDETERHGCKVFGPLLYGFTVWLSEQLRKDDIQDVLFLAREGFIMKQAFDELHIAGIRTHYIYCSRRALQVAVLWEDSDFESVVEFLFRTKYLSLRKFISRIGLETENYEDLIKAYGLNMDTMYKRNEFIHSEDIRSFYESIRGDVVANSKKEYEASLAYFSDLNISKRLALVDVGWEGSMQSGFVRHMKLSGNDSLLVGYYMGITYNKLAFSSGKLNGQGYLFSYDRNERLSNEIGKVQSLFEAAFIAFHGSLKRYLLVDGKGVPEFYNYEYDSGEKCRIDETEFIGKVQNGMMAYLRYMLTAFSGNTIKIDPNIAIKPFIRMSTHPTSWEADHWGDCRIFDLDQVWWIAVKSNELWKYVLHPKLLREKKYIAAWRIGLMKRIFRLPLPYDKLDHLISALGQYF